MIARGIFARGVLALLLRAVVFVGPVAAEERVDPTPLHRTLSSPPGWIRAEAGLERSCDMIERLWPEAARHVAAGLHLAQPAPVEIVLLRGSTFRPWSRGLVPEWGIGFATWPGGPIVLDIDAVATSRKSFDEVLRHEISHVYLGQRLEHSGVPKWFVEGVAQSQSGEWRFLDTVSLVEAAAFDRLPSLHQIAGRFPAGGQQAELAYRVSLQAVLDLQSRLQERGGWIALVDAAAQSGRFDLAFREELGVTLHVYGEQFHERLEIRYGWFTALGRAGTLFTVMTALFLLGALRAYLKRRRRLAEMAREERGWAESGPRPKIEELPGDQG